MGKLGALMHTEQSVLRAESLGSSRQVMPINYAEQEIGHERDKS